MGWSLKFPWDGVWNSHGMEFETSMGWNLKLSTWVSRAGQVKGSSRLFHTYPLCSLGTMPSHQPLCHVFDWFILWFSRNIKNFIVSKPNQPKTIHFIAAVHLPLMYNHLATLQTLLDLPENILIIMFFITFKKFNELLWNFVGASNTHEASFGGPQLFTSDVQECGNHLSVLFFNIFSLGLLRTSSVSDFPLQRNTTNLKTIQKLWRDWR